QCGVEAARSLGNTVAEHMVQEPVPCRTHRLFFEPVMPLARGDQDRFQGRYPMQVLDQRRRDARRRQKLILDIDQSARRLDRTQIEPLDLPDFRPSEIRRTRPGYPYRDVADMGLDECRPRIGRCGDGCEVGAPEAMPTLPEDIA